MSEEIKQDWRKELEHVVKYRLTTDFVTDRQILTELFDSLLSQAVQAEHDRWANQTANAHDNKIREITLQKRDGNWRLAIMHLPTEQRESVLKTFETLNTK